MRTFQYLLLRSLGVMLGLVDFLCLSLVIGMVGPPILARYFPLKDGETYGVWDLVQRHLEPFQRPIVALVRAFLPHTYNGQDVSLYIAAALLLAFCLSMTKLLRQIRVGALEMEELNKIAEAEEASRNVHGSLTVDNLSDRDKVLEVYAQAKKILEGQKRDVAFLAVDVVNSTGMKQGEDPVLAERDFRRYRDIVETAIARHEALKAAWTPDGVMICFSTLGGAISAAQALIIALTEFNRAGKTIKADFHVRCGVNAGQVLFDESVPMEQMTDGSIDLAGHMQKYAEPGTIFAARTLIETRGIDMGFRLVEKKVDGVEVCAWSA